METNIDYQKILRDYRDNGVVLEADLGKLRYKSRKGALTPEQLEFIKLHRDELIKVLEVKSDTADFPLTDIQSAYLLGRRESFHYGGVNCQIYMELDYADLELAETNYAWNALIQKHEMLRAIIQDNGNQLIQETVPDYRLEYSDLSGDGDQSKLESAREGYLGWQSEIGAWPFFKLGLTKLPKQTILHICFDFLIVDWTSIWILIREFEQLYFNPAQFNADNQLTFRDYLRLEDELKRGIKYQADKKYWEDRIHGFPGCPQIPILDQSKLENSFIRKQYDISYDGWETFKGCAQQYNCTPTAAVLTAYGLCLARWSETADFCLNLTMLNRLPLHPQVQNLVGDFTSVNLLEMHTKTDLSFVENMKLVQDRLSQDLDHSTYSGVKLLRGIARDAGQDEALYPYVFTGSIGLVEDGQRQGQLGGCSISQTPQVFIDCQAMDSRDGLRVNWDIRAGVFKKDVIDAMFESFCQAMDDLAAQTKSWQRNDLIQLPAKQKAVRDAVNNTAKIIPFTPLHGQFFQNSRRRPKAIAVIDQDGECTYQELARLAGKFAKVLKSSGCQKGDGIGILIADGRYQLAAVLGVLMVGAVYVPLDEKQPDNRIVNILASISVSVVIVNAESAGRNMGEVKKIVAKQVVSDNQLYSDEKYTEAVSEDDLAYIIFTSGSTGVPKGVQITHAAANNTITDINQKFKVTETDKVLSLSRLNFDLSVYDIFGLLSAGGTVVFANNDQYINPQHWHELIEKHQITIWNTVPSTMQLLLDYLDRAKADLLGLRLVLVSGDWIPVTMRKRLNGYHSELEMIGLGGATEASIWSNYHICTTDDDEKDSVPYGVPLANQGFQILNERFEICPDYVMGELYIMGSGLSVGYANDEEQNRTHFLTDESGSRMYRTGDYGFYNSKGEIIFCGRKDLQIKVRGHRIELGEISKCILDIPQVKECCVLVTGIIKNQIIAAVTINDAITKAAILERLKEVLPEYMLPVHIMIMEQLPLSANGKVDHQAIRNSYSDSVHEKETVKVRTAVTELEKHLLGNMEKHLGMIGLPIDDNLYNFGADSLILARYIGEVIELLNQRYPEMDFSYDNMLRQLLNMPTISELNIYICEQIKQSQVIIEKEPDKSKRLGLFTLQGDQTDGVARIVFHAGLGTMNCFRYFLPMLIEQQLGPVYSVTIRDMEQYCEMPAETLLERLGEEYAEQIQELGYKEVQLIGYCMGGLIALETARCLAGSDVEITDFLLVESAPVIFDIGELTVLELVFITNYYITVEQVYNEITNEELMAAILFAFYASGESLRQVDMEVLSDYLEHQKAYQFLHKLENIPQEQRFADYVAAIKREVGNDVPQALLYSTYKLYVQSFLASKFDAQPYFGDLRYLEAREPLPFVFTVVDENRRYWEERCIGDLEMIPVPGNHVSCMEDPENAAVIAQWARKGLESGND